MIELDAVGFAYPRTDVLRDITAKVGPGEFVCIAGANGAGKTTLLKLIAGLLHPTSGTVRFSGSDPATTKRMELARQLAYLPQEYRLAFPFSVEEVVLMGRYAHSRGAFRLETQTDVAQARAAMELCDVAHLAARRWSELSGGERRRALLAQALCQQTKAILLDEPTASLDPAHAITVFRALAAASHDRNACVMAVTHDLNLAARFADRLWLLGDGLLSGDDAPVAVLSSPEAEAAFAVPMHVGRLPGGEAFVVPL